MIQPDSLLKALLEDLNVNVTGKTNETLLTVIETINEIADEIISNSTAWLNKINSVIEEVRDYLQVRIITIGLSFFFFLHFLN